MLDLYQSQILERSRAPRYAGTLEDATHTGEGSNLSCGDEVLWQAVITDGVFTKLRHSCRACAVCAASADLLAQEFEGHPVDILAQWDAPRVTELLGIPLSPTRLKCALLPLEALSKLTISV